MSTVSTDLTLLAADHWDGPPAWWPVFPIAWLLVIATVVTVLVVTARRRAEQAGARAGEARLAERYAAGEIEVDEYQARREVLRGR